jgi:hypothetical protein
MSDVALCKAFHSIEADRQKQKAGWSLLPAMKSNSRRFVQYPNRRMAYSTLSSGAQPAGGTKVPARGFLSCDDAKAAEAGASSHRYEKEMTMPSTRKVDDISREEDFRDYEDRNIDEGWPYDDAAGAGARPVDNAAYGQPAANFDDDRNGGFKIDEAGFDGLEERLVDSNRPAETGVEDADEIEERVNDAIEALGIVSMDSIDLHVENGTVTIEGMVDEAQAARQIIHAARQVAGVRRVVSRLQVDGVDGRIPNED